MAGAGGFDEGDGERTGLLERERAQQIRFVQEPPLPPVLTGHVSSLAPY